MKQAKVLSVSSKYITLEVDEHDFQPGQQVYLSSDYSQFIQHTTGLAWPAEQVQQEQPANEAEQ